MIYYMYMSQSNQMVKCSLRCKKFSLACCWTLTESGSIFHVIKVYYYKYVKYFRERIITLGIQMHFRIQERSYIPVSLSIDESISFGKIQLASNSVQFATVPKHDSWEASTEDNAKNVIIYELRKGRMHLSNTYQWCFAQKLSRWQNSSQVHQN